MPKITEMPPPLLPFTGLELVPGVQGGSNVSFPLGAVLDRNVLAVRRRMRFDKASTSDSDPGAGNIRLGANSNLYVSNTDLDRGDLAPTWKQIQPGGFLLVQVAGTPEKRAAWAKLKAKNVEPGDHYSKIAAEPASGFFDKILDQDAIEVTVLQSSVLTTASRNGVLTLDVSSGRYFVTTLFENVTKIDIVNSPDACSINMRVMQDAGTPRSMAFPDNYKVEKEAKLSDKVGSRNRVTLTTDDAGRTWDVSIHNDFS